MIIWHFRTKWGDIARKMAVACPTRIDARRQYSHLIRMESCTVEHSTSQGGAATDLNSQL